MIESTQSQISGFELLSDSVVVLTQATQIEL